MKKTMLALAVALLTTGTLGAFTAEDILKVQPGMNIKEVEALLGKPRMFSPATQEALGGPRKVMASLRLSPCPHCLRGKSKRRF